VDIPPSLALGAEKIEPDAMLRPPRNPKKAILGKRYLNALIVQVGACVCMSSCVYMCCVPVCLRIATQGCVCRACEVVLGSPRAPHPAGPSS
jgi:hypothetical protein